MLFLIDEDVTRAAAAVLEAAGATIQFATDTFGTRSDDDELARYAGAKGMVLVTADRRLAGKLRQRRRCGCLWLHDLGTAEADRLSTLIEVVLSEAALVGPLLWMEVRMVSYLVQR